MQHVDSLHHVTNKACDLKSLVLVKLWTLHLLTRKGPPLLVLATLHTLLTD